MAETTNIVTEINLQRDAVDQESLLRLDVAASIAFPFGGMSKNGLRRELARGRLDGMKIAGKYFTTLANIKRMSQLCRVSAKDLISGSDRPDERTVKSSRRQFGLSKIVANISPQDVLQLQLIDDRRKQQKQL